MEEHFFVVIGCFDEAEAVLESGDESEQHGSRGAGGPVAGAGAAAAAGAVGQAVLVLDRHGNQLLCSLHLGRNKRGQTFASFLTL